LTTNASNLLRAVQGSRIVGGAPRPQAQLSSDPDGGLGEDAPSRTGARDVTAQVIHGELTTLRPVAATDLDRLTAWFSDPEVYQWWDGSPKTREEVAEKYLGQRPPPPVVNSFIIEAGGEPIGYIHREPPRTPAGSACS
jgi:hypothetical protein